jgi:hypothetical protein
MSSNQVASIYLAVASEPGHSPSGYGLAAMRRERLTNNQFRDRML